MKTEVQDPTSGIEKFVDIGTVQLRVVLSNLPSQHTIVLEAGGSHFSGLSTQPQPGTMVSPGELYQGVPSDFTAFYRSFELPAFGE